MDNPHGASAVDSDSERLAALEVEVLACLPAFPVLRAQLNQSVTQVEQAVVEVCASFQSIVGRARESVSQATASLSHGIAGSARESSSQALITVAHAMLERTEAASRMTLQTVETMEEVEEQMRRITGSLHDVEEIARTLKVLGLNANIEAARAGVHGKTFAVVAVETTRLAGAATQISKSVQKIVAQLRTSVDETSQKLRTVSTALGTDSRSSRTEFDLAVGVMTATEENLRRSVEHSARSSEALANDISRAVVAMQFQDSMSQKVIHVVDALGEVEAGLSKFVGPGAAERPAEQRQVPRDVAGTLMSRYTMQSERDIHVAKLGMPQNSTDSLGDNVELF